MMLCVDAGHGGNDPGCTNGQYYEKNFTLSIARALKKKLNEIAPNIEIVMTRNADVSVTLDNRCKIANSNNATAFLSIHINAGSTTASGIETLCYTMDGDTGNLARKVHNSLIESCKLHDRGIKIRTDLYVLKHTKMPAILVECGFIVGDLTFLLNNTNNLVTGLSNGLISVLGGGNVNVTVENNVNNVDTKIVIKELENRKIINSPEYWENAVNCVKHLDKLLLEFYKYCVNNKM